MTGSKKVPKAKRLTPKPEVLRELYILSGNNCAMPDCNNVIIDHAGVVVGHVCHIEAAMPDGPRFNFNQTNDQRRALSNLVLMCAGHHAQIDSKKHEKKWTVAALQKIKAGHEKKFLGLDNSLQQAFKNSYVDSTDSLIPTLPESFSELERFLPDCKLRSDEEPKRRKQIGAFIQKLGRVPEDERKFMAGVIRRAIKLDTKSDTVCVHVDDIKGAFKMGHSKIKTIGDALQRYGVGSVDLAGTINDRDEPHVMLMDPSEYLTWFDIAQFCEASSHDIDDFVLRLKFGILDGA